MSIDATSGRSTIELRQGEQHRGDPVAVDRRLAAERPEDRGGPQVVEHVVGVALVERRQADRDVGDASARTPPTPTMTHGPNCGSRARPR